MPSVKESADYQEYAQLSARPLACKPFQLAQDGGIDVQLGELFCRYIKEGKETFCVEHHRFGSSNALRQHVTNLHGALAKRDGGKPTNDMVQKAHEFYARLMDNHRGGAGDENKQAEEVETQIEKGCGPIPLHPAKHKTLGGRVNSKAARAALGDIGFETFPCNACKNDKECVTHKTRGTCEYMKYFSEVPSMEEETGQDD